MSPRRLDPLLRPRSVVVVGASTNPSFVSAILRNLSRAGFAGQLAAVNPRYEAIGDVACFPSVLDVPWSIDLAVIGVSWRQFAAVLAQCEQKRVGALVVITSGFAESGGEGITRQAELAAWAERSGTPVGGPNCLGIMHVPTGLHALPSPFLETVAGQVGLILQSGMMAPSVLTPLFARNIGVTYAVTTGNEVNVDLAEYIQYLVDDEQTRVIGCFAEQIKRPQAFIRACEAARVARKPIVMLKIGRSEAAQHAALAHTGSLVGADAVINTVLEKHGVTRVSSVDELFEALAVFHTRRLPRGDGLAAVSVSGGAAGLLSDLAGDCGVRFSALREQTQAGLREVVPEYGSVGNPLDVTGQGVFVPELLERSLDLLANDPGVDAIVYARSFAARMDGESPAYRTLERVSQAHPEIPFLAMALAGGHFFPSATLDVPIQRPLDRLDGVPFLQGAEYGLRAVGALLRYARFVRQRAEPVAARRSASDAADTARRVLAQAQARRGRLSSNDGGVILDAYGIPRVAETLATTIPDALAAANRIGYPVAAKVEAPSVSHKARAGGVVLNIADASALQDEFGRLAGVASDAEGVVIQQMVGDALVEVIVGMSRDAQFGPVIACGLGGVFVEALSDVQLLLPPVSSNDVSLAFGRLRGAALLRGIDLDQVIDVVLRFSELCVDLADEFRAIDLNPLMLRRDGGVVAVDSLFET